MMMLFPTFNKQLARIVCVGVCGRSEGKLFLASHLASRQHIQQGTFMRESTLQFIFPIIIIKLHFPFDSHPNAAKGIVSLFCSSQTTTATTTNEDDDGRKTANEGCL